MQRGLVITFAASANKARERAARSPMPENALGGRKCSEISAIGCAHARQLTSVGGRGFGRPARNNLGPALDRSTSTAACSTSASQERLPGAFIVSCDELRTRQLRRESATFFVSEWGDGPLRPHDRTGRGWRRRGAQGTSTAPRLRPRAPLANKGHDTRAIQGWFGHRSITTLRLHASTRP
jgi:hypothetical protein